MTIPTDKTELGWSNPSPEYCSIATAHSVFPHRSLSVVYIISAFNPSCLPGFALDPIVI